MIVSLLSWFALLMLLFPLWEPLLGSKVVGKLTGSVPIALNHFPLSLLRIMSLAIIRFCPSRLIPLSIDLHGVLFPKGPTSDVPKNVPLDEWRERLEIGWTRASTHFSLRETLDDPSKSVQVKWDTFQNAVRGAFVFAPQSNFPSSGQIRHKGLVAQVKMETLPAKGIFTSMQERKLRHQLAKWYELSRLRSRFYTQDDLSQQHGIELRNLSYKLTGRAELPSRQLIQQNIAHVHETLRKCEETSRQNNLTNWRHRMRSGSGYVSKWIKRKTQVFCQSVVDRHNRPTQTWHAAAAAIQDFWVHFWQDHARSVPDLASRTSSLLAGARVPETPVNIRCPTGIELQARAQSGSGAAGPDGWSADEIKHLPLETFESLSQLFTQFASSGEVPIQLQQARMVCLPKPGKVKNYAVPVDGTRPITVLNVWWRLWVSTLCQSKGLKAWLKTALHPSIGAVSNQDIFENLISIFDHFHQQGFLLTLDYSKAFDTISTDMSVSLLEKYGWPPNITGLLNAVWGSQNRFIQYDHHTHSEPLKAHGILPQGDPLGPIICSLWVQSGVMSVSTSSRLEAGPSSMQIYLDDRTCTSSSVQDLFTLKEGWSRWSHSVGLLENLQKAEVSGVGSFRLAALHEKFDATMISPAVRVLGAVSWSGRRQLHRIEKDRIAAAKATARLLGCCGFLLPTQLCFLKQFALPKANYGWVARGPTWTVASSLWATFWVSTRRVRYSSPWLRALFLGGGLHLDVAWVTRLVAAVLRARFRSCDPSWSNHGGTCSGALRSWFRSHYFTSVRPWVWRHPVASVEVDLSVRPGPKMLEPLIGLAQHNVREGWGAWVWKKYSQCGRHEVQSLPVSDQTFPSLDIKNTRSWILSSPVAATVGLGATFSPGTYSRIPSSSRSSACPWGCGGVGFWEHIAWECPYRLGPFPPKPSCPFLARFGWAQKTSCPNEVLKVRCWLAKCQDSIWNTKEPGN